MKRLALVLLILLAGSATAEAPCAPDIPDDLFLVCYQGHWNAVSPSAGQRLVFRQRCETPV